MIRAQPFRACSATLALLLVAGALAPAHAQDHGDDYDEADPWSGVRSDKRGRTRLL